MNCTHCGASLVNNDEATHHAGVCPAQNVDPFDDWLSTARLHAPGWAVWLSLERDGWAYFFEKKPVKDQQAGVCFRKSGRCERYSQYPGERVLKVMRLHPAIESRL